MGAEGTERREDRRLVTGRGHYAADAGHEGALHAVFVRAPYAAARILGLDCRVASAMPGVVAILTARDLDADQIPDFSTPMKLPRPDGTFATETARPLLVRDRVRFLAEPVAMVLATSWHAAADAADSVEVDYEADTPVLTPAAAMAEAAPQLWDNRPGNLAYDWSRGDAEGVRAALKASTHVARLEARITRVAAMAMEPRVAVAWIAEDGRPTIQLSHQSPHQFRNNLMKCFGLPKDGLRVLAADVGGSFGMKSGLLREETLCFWAARRLGRAVRWVADRGESLLGDEHARDVDVQAELGLDAEGRFTALHVRYDVNVGAYASGRSGAPIGNFGGIAGVYLTPLIHGEAKGWFTNTQATSPYRGAGRPDATFVIERIIDIAAAETGIDPVELRRRNLIPPEAMPYQTPFVFRYDCGDFGRVMDRALELADHAGFPARRAEAGVRGMLRGFGLANPIEVAGGPYARPGTDYAHVRVNTDGNLTLNVGAMSTGQGLETALPRLLAGELGVAADRIRHVAGDTDAIPDGKGSGGSSALIICGTAIRSAAADLIEQGRALAADRLGQGGIVFQDGLFRLEGSNQSIGLGELAEIAAANGTPFEARSSYSPSHATFPNGCHIVEVEIDPETGKVELVNYVSVEDVGTVLNPVLVEGQIHGGVAQGAGQALFEEIRYDSEGQLLTGSFMDYAMPRSVDLPRIISENLEVPTQLNPLGVKGVGEAGTVGAMAAVMNAVCNTLLSEGITHFDMPATPARVWQAIHRARQDRSG